MTIRQYVTIMVCATLMCWVSLGFVVVNVDPYYANVLSLFFFYLSLLLSLVGTTSLMLFFLYRLFTDAATPVFRLVRRSFRGGLFLSVLLVTLLILYVQNVLSGWIAGMFFLFLLFFAAFLVSYSKPGEMPVAETE